MKRRFVIQLLTPPKRNTTQRQLSSLTVSVTGKATVHLPVPKSAGSGTYEVEVRIYKPGRNGQQTGKSVKQVFILS